MNAVHSLWTGTPRFHPERGPLLVHTLSLCLANEHFQHVELVTDRRGLELSELLGWRYTSYLNCLDELTQAGLTHVWALGKFTAILQQSEPFLQIDTDVLLASAFRRELRHARLVAQSIDYPQYYAGVDMESAIRHAGLPSGRVAYNCGVIGGTDIRLLHRYARESIHLARRFFGHNLNGTTTSMAVEQYHLGDFARRHHCRVETVLPLIHTDADRREHGYDHLTGDSKRETGRVDECESYLSRHFPDAYLRFVNGWARLTANERRSAVPAGSN